MDNEVRFVEVVSGGNWADEVLRLYAQPRNRPHLTGCPQTRDEMTAFLSTRGNRVWALIDITDSAVATLAMREPLDDEYIGTWFRYICVDEDLHGQGLGRHVIEQALEWAFAVRTPTGFERYKILLATIDDIEGSQAIKSLITHLGFEKCGDTYRADGLSGGHVRVRDGDAWLTRDVSDYQLYEDQFDRLRSTGTYHTI